MSYPQVVCLSVFVIVYACHTQLPAILLTKPYIGGETVPAHLGPGCCRSNLRRLESRLLGEISFGLYQWRVFSRASLQYSLHFGVAWWCGLFLRLSIASTPVFGHFDMNLQAQSLLSRHQSVQELVVPSYTS